MRHEPIDSFRRSSLADHRRRAHRAARPDDFSAGTTVVFFWAPSDAQPAVSFAVGSAESMLKSPCQRPEQRCDRQGLPHTWVISP